MTNIVFGPCS